MKRHTISWNDITFENHSRNRWGAAMTLVRGKDAALSCAPSTCGIFLGFSDCLSVRLFLSRTNTHTHIHTGTQIYEHEREKGWQHAEHQQTIEGCDAVKNCNWGRAAELYLEAATEAEVAGTQGHHIVFVLDESGSMVCFKISAYIQTFKLCTYIMKYVMGMCVRKKKREQGRVG